MSVKLRVGDIEIDGTEVRVQNALARVGPGAAPPASEAPRPPGLVVQLLRLPIAPVWWVLAGAMLAGLGALLLATSAYLIGAGLTLMSGGVGLAGLGLFKRRFARADRAARRRRLAEELAPVVRRLRELLSPDSPATRATVGELVNRLALPEPSVLYGLQLLREEGALREELNTDTGEWFYFLAPRELDSGSRDLDARLRELERSGA